MAIMRIVYIRAEILTLPKSITISFFCPTHTDRPCGSPYQRSAKTRYAA